ncbi:hypothetical protein [Bradyrhizobium sp. SSUT77]|uniref:hypothetical protein n=1 Tax=Bradyrhizobium sp. SSUT77 TaxID=3040603 RepID=UPI00244BE547|nr:hypothetical protein [Bradyrhizobium sp. SSUT77]MDH2348410.1 hypothetical protein [Bradyrhizobium sp. SSUT77]
MADLVFRQQQDERYIALDTRRSALSKWNSVIEKAVLAKATRLSLDQNFPNSLLPRVLRERPELIDAGNLARLSDNAPEDLLAAEQETDVRGLIANEMIRRDLGASEDKAIESWPFEIVRGAVDAYVRGSLDRSWLTSIPRHQDAVLASQ